MKNPLKPDGRWVLAGSLKKLSRFPIRTLALVALLPAALGLYVMLRAQQTESDPPAKDIIGDWDFTGMTLDEKNAALHLMFPEQYYEEWLKTRTPEQLQELSLSLFAATDPETYAQFYPTVKTPEEEADAWAISHPLEYTAALMAKKSSEQLAADAASEWAFLHPDEAAKLEADARTPEEEVRRQEAIEAIAHPIFKPAPVSRPQPSSDF